MDMGKQSVVSSFNYYESSDSGGALIFSSKKCLEALANATWWSSDATFSMLRDSSIKFITVSIKKEDESRAEMAGISEAFNNRVKVTNCVWHKTMNIEK
ncbi:hypothetical protein DAPK24_019720 [Pichia kluyveri]|uniref:Uncharacterized protein n=1 Tax=Pichia kluyveri TaxID=36015 RepID=A0AAV5R339_PICKL|nr:hypothetical protein DAPK24_019720 [Pichia kluyveri]